MSKGLPNNWTMAYTGDCFNLVYGKGLGTKELIPEGYFVYGANGIIGRYSSYIYERPKVIISCRGAASGVIHKTVQKSFITSNSIVLDDMEFNLLNLDFVKYAFRSIGKSHIITGSAQPQITIQLLKDLKFPLAPLNEQKRIAEKLDEIFLKFDHSKERLEKIPKILKSFRQIVLQLAINGELTKDWRSKNAFSFSNELSDFSTNKIGWKIIMAQDACEKVSSGSTPINNPFTQTGDIPFLKVYNIQNQQIAFDYKPQFITSEIHKKKLTRSIVKPNDVLMNIVGPPLGKIALVTDQYPEWNINQAIVFFRPKKYLLPKYLYYVLCEGREIENISLELKGSAGQQNISLTQSRNFVFDIPSIEEQELIVSKIDALFDLAKSIEEKYDQVKAKIDKLPESILEKAFKGELVEQDENDEPAEKLLERILVEKQKMKKI